jgi:hypothetical protein
VTQDSLAENFPGVREAVSRPCGISSIRHLESALVIVTDTNQIVLYNYNNTIWACYEMCYNMSVFEDLH